uniref:CWH43-like N-terminal domain-containing protein n=1 Tax=Timema cristinae TaxID=61476 RepID=A0A7R9H8W7_TIMCR|nr:unnamed protein product [Timema cristinae]
MSTSVMIGTDYLPLHHKSKGHALRVPFSKLAWITVSLPLLGFIFCVIWSILFNYERSTYTHCEVANYLPSISAAIGSYSPQNQVWKTAIFIHAGPRFLIARMYYKYYQSVLYHWIHFLAAIACWLNVAENLALVGLTFISSSENYSVHEKCFMMFMVTSELYMMLTCYLLRSMRCQPPDNVETRSLRIKYQLLVVNVISFALAAYFFLRHNWYCEPGVYSLFSLCEYVVVLTNMGFHMTASWDFHGRELLVWLPGPQEKAPRRVPPLASDETLSFPCLPLVDPSPLGVMARHSVESIVRQIPTGPAECRCPLWTCDTSRDMLPTYQQYVYMMVDHRVHRCEGLVALGHVTNLPAVCVYDGGSQGTQV